MGFNSEIEPSDVDEITIPIQPSSPLIADSVRRNLVVLRGQRAQRRPCGQGGQGKGDVWTCTAICQDSKLIVSYLVGDRDSATAHAFVEDLADRLGNRVQLTTDGLKLYLNAVEKAFGWAKIDCVTLVKIYGSSPDIEANRRYSRAECMGADKVPVMGNPNLQDVSTSHVERNNLTIQMHMWRTIETPKKPGIFYLRARE